MTCYVGQHLGLRELAENVLMHIGGSFRNRLFWLLFNVEELVFAGSASPIDNWSEDILLLTWHAVLPKHIKL